MQRSVFAADSAEKCENETLWIWNNEKQQRAVWGSASGRGTCNVKPAGCMLHGDECFFQKDCRIQPGDISAFARQYSREDGTYIQRTMTELKSDSKVAEVTICETGQLKKGVSVCLPRRVSQGHFYRNYYALLPLTFTSVQRKSDFITST